MKRLIMLVFAMFVLFTGKVYAFDPATESAHRYGYVFKDIYVSTENGYELINGPVYTFMYNYHTRAIHNEMARYNVNYEEDSPFLGLPNDIYSYYDENGEMFTITHPQLVKGIDRDSLYYNDIPRRFQDLTNELYKFNINKHGDVKSYIKKIFDSNIGNVVEYHEYYDINQIIVYFDDLSSFTITYTDTTVTYCEYKGKMKLIEAENYANWMNNHIVMKQKEPVQIDNETIAFNYTDENGKYTMFSMRNRFVQSYIQGNHFIVYLNISNINPSANIAG